MGLSEDHSAPEIHLNPEILARKKPGLVKESCLSVPGWWAVLGSNQRPIG